MKLYRELSEFYFSIEEKNRDISKDIRLIKTLMRAYNAPSLLDIGCGSGEHIHLLHKAGFRCTGIDSSEEMLKIARIRFPGQGTFLNQSMTNFDFFEEFDIAISLFGSFDYMINDSDVESVFWNTWRSLKPGGTGLFEIWNALPVSRIQEKEISHVSDTRYDDTLILRKRGFRLLNHPGRTVVEVNYEYEISRRGEKQTVRDRHVMRAFSREEIEKFILNNGFDIKDFYSSPDQDPYQDYSNKILVHFEKK